MKLAELLSAVDAKTALLPDQRDREITGIAYDSRKVVAGTLFVAVRGFHSDGHKFIAQATKQGAAAVIAEEDGAAILAEKGCAAQGADAVPVVYVADTRAALARLAATFYGHPSQRLRLVGITGTNGKTTTSYLIKSIIEAAGQAAGLIGTIDYRVGNKVYPAPNTTPESLDLQKLLAEMVDAGAGYCVMEVSSHALALGRTNGCVFETAVFTNLTQDHLDFHKDMRSYFEAKLLLFTGLSPDKIAVVNADDPVSEELIRRTNAKVSTTGMSGRADIHPVGAIGHTISGLSFSVQTPIGKITIESPLMGRHNVYNILSAIGAGLSLSFGSDAIAQGIRNMKSVPGRMETVDEGQPFGVVVDYAHTEDALARLLEAVREVAKGKVITLFGCGGDRDRTKRPKMGVAALQGSGIVIVTSDNPRSEDAMDIIREIEAGMAAGVRMQEPGPPRTEGKEKIISGKKPYYVIPDRAEAIETAINLARPDDVVVLAGKGHEDYQIIGDTKRHFDDREEARKAIRKLYNADCRLRIAE